METILPGPSASGNRIITVANTTNQGVTVQVCDPLKADQQSDDHKIWLGTIRRGRIEVSPPTPPRLLHALVIRDTNETRTLAQAQFAHPEEEDTLFQVFTSEATVKVERREDPTQSAPDVQDTMPAEAVGSLVIAIAAKKYAATE